MFKPGSFELCRGALTNCMRYWSSGIGAEVGYRRHLSIDTVRLSQAGCYDTLGGVAFYDFYVHPHCLALYHAVPILNINRQQAHMKLANRSIRQYSKAELYPL